MGRPKHLVTWEDALPVLNGHRLPDWECKARKLHATDPKKFSLSALARLFHKNSGTMWWALNPEWRTEEVREKYQRQKEQHRVRSAARHQRNKDDPDYRRQRAINCKRWRLREKHNAKMGWVKTEQGWMK